MNDKALEKDNTGETSEIFDDAFFEDIKRDRGGIDSSSDSDEQEEKCESESLKKTENPAGENKKNISSLEIIKIKESKDDTNTFSKMRIFEFWPGNNKFMCKGKFLNGNSKDSKNRTLTLTVIIGSFIFYLLLPAQYIFKKVNKWSVYLTVYLFSISIFFLFMTVSTDPGIIPRRKFLQLQRIMEWRKDDKEKLIWDHVGKKRCSSCKVWRPPRSNHCKVCDNCIEIFDHHCTFIGNCIGRLNYKYFFGFILSTVLLLVSECIGFFMYIAEVFLAKADIVTPLLIRNSFILVIVLILILIPTALVTIFVFSLCIFHIYLIYMGKTTKEKLKNTTIVKDKDDQENIKWWKRKAVKPLLSFSMLLTKSEAEYLSNYDIMQKILVQPQGSLTQRSLLHSSTLDLL